MRKHFVPNERYRAYLDSPEWKAMRKAVKKRCNNVCERCHKFRVDEVHHLTYDRVFNERLEDLQGLCVPCHRFLHGDSGIDPCQPSISVKVTARTIEFLDSEARKLRRVKRTTEGAEGEYRVPMEVFLDGGGNPVLEPSRWQSYRTAYRHGRGWMRYGSGGEGRRVPRDPETVKAEVMEVEARKAEVHRRLQKSPERFTSYQDNPPKTPKETIVLFKRYPRILDAGSECRIKSVRETKRSGVVLDLQMDKPGHVIWYKIYHAEECLANGSILLDHERGIWVSKDQQPLSPDDLARLGKVAHDSELVLALAPNKERRKSSVAVFTL